METNPFEPPSTTQDTKGGVASLVMKYVLVLLSGTFALGTLGLSVLAITSALQSLFYTQVNGVSIPVMIATSIMYLFFSASFSTAAFLTFRRGGLAVIFFFAPFVALGVLILVFGLR